MNRRRTKKEEKWSDDDLDEDPDDLEDFLKFSDEIERDPTPGEFVLTRFVKKNSEIYYVAQIVNKINDEFEVIFYRKNLKKENCFVRPTVDDISMITKNDIKLILPNPIQTGATKRQQSFLSFGLTFNSINLR
ncbi:hypothetical protein ABEB36_012651 [Hypothenemus hampei]|uniref:Uncharacterized protein n=1 Tax=Hypothenemus hampei TaxID=57062 RepID=A0ABD1EC21_HYPHA